MNWSETKYVGSQIAWALLIVASFTGLLVTVSVAVLEHLPTAAAQSPDRDEWSHAAVSYTVDRSAMVRIGEDSNGREIWLVVPRVYGEDLSAMVDGTRTKFPTMKRFRSGSEVVYLNGVCLDRGRHYTVGSDDGKGIGIELALPPGFTSDGSPDRLKVDYDAL